MDRDFKGGMFYSLKTKWIDYKITSINREEKHFIW